MAESKKNGRTNATEVQMKGHDMPDNGQCYSEV